MSIDLRKLAEEAAGVIRGIVDAEEREQITLNYLQRVQDDALTEGANIGVFMRKDRPVAPVEKEGTGTEDNPPPKCKVCGEGAKYDSAYCSDHQGTTANHPAPWTADQIIDKMAADRQHAAWPDYPAKTLSTPAPQTAKDVAADNIIRRLLQFGSTLHDVSKSRPIDEIFKIGRRLIQKYADSQKLVPDKDAVDVARDIHKEVCSACWGTPDEDDPGIPKIAALITAYVEQQTAEARRHLNGVREQLSYLRGMHRDICGEYNQTVAALRAENERLIDWNHRVSVCEKHTADIVDGGCVICENRQLREQKSDLFLSGQIAKLRKENAVLIRVRDGLVHQVGDLQAIIAKHKTEIAELKKEDSDEK